VGAWEDRFSYDTLLAQYNFAVGTGRVSSFMQELMLRISSFENRLVQDGEIVWESRAKILQNRGDYNFYITTDFATSHKKRADFSVIFVWAYCTAGKWHLIDGICERQTMDKNINKLFEYVREYSPQSVGVEVSGQQRAFIDWLKSEMLVRSLWFTFASSSQDNSPGVRPAVDKLVRFNLVVPWFKSGLIVFPEELKSSAIMARILQQISMTTMDGIKGKDDCIDGISMLGYLKPWKPVLGGTAQAVLEDDDADFRYEVASISNYLV
jgi:predicted phage terminase large subunit-like protein